MMPLGLSEGTDAIGESQRVGEAREVEDPLESGDAVTLKQLPAGDLALELCYLRFGHPGRIAATSDAPFRGQRAHSAHLPGALRARPGSRPRARAAAPHPLRPPYTSYPRPSGGVKRMR
jgi:hypothetical protein